MSATASVVQYCSCITSAEQPVHCLFCLSEDCKAMRIDCEAYFRGLRQNPMHAQCSSLGVSLLQPSVSSISWPEAQSKASTALVTTSDHESLPYRATGES